MLRREPYDWLVEAFERYFGVSWEDYYDPFWGLAARDLARLPDRPGEIGGLILHEVFTFMQETLDEMGRVAQVDWYEWRDYMHHNRSHYETAKMIWKDPPLGRGPAGEAEVKIREWLEKGE